MPSNTPEGPGPDELCFEGKPAPLGSVFSVDILSTPELNLRWIETLAALPEGPRNKFVCLQLITMVKEAFQAFHIAPPPTIVALPPPLPVLQPEPSPPSTTGETSPRSQNLEEIVAHHFACLRVDGLPVAAAVFRHCGGQSQSAYLDLLVSNCSGRKYGTHLLAHIEDHCCLKWGSALNGGMKVLSTESAAGFWRRCGYNGPDENHFLMKKLTPELI